MFTSLNVNVRPSAIHNPFVVVPVSTSPFSRSKELVSFEMSTFFARASVVANSISAESAVAAIFVILPFMVSLSFPVPLCRRLPTGSPPPMAFRDETP